MSETDYYWELWWRDGNKTQFEFLSAHCDRFTTLAACLRYIKLDCIERNKANSGHTVWRNLRKV